MARDYYLILGLAKTATSEEVKTAYRRLALKVHPDVNRDLHSEVRFREITEAYGVLIDPHKRKEYDRNHVSFEQQRIFEDIFTHTEYSKVFNEMPLKPEWIEKFFNMGRFFIYEAFVYGGRPKDVIRRGLIKLAIKGATSFFHNVMDIHQSIVVPRSIAHRGGYITLEYKPGFNPKQIKVHIPQNIQSGTVLRVQGMGRTNFAKKAGDLYLHVAVSVA